MKMHFCSPTLVALAVVVVAAAGTVSQAQPQPLPQSAAGGSLPAAIVPGSPLADVVKMIQAGVEVSTIKSYILNAQSAFNLDADEIIYLTDLGVPSDLIDAMLDRDKVLYAATVVPPPVPAPAGDLTAPSAPEMAPPPTDVTTEYFNDTLAPYGSWVPVEGYGQCWRPTAVTYDAGWSPYCDRGHWVNTDYGWYWDSDYAWGVTFHYGRWFRSARFGWCWYPDTVWAPSWVAWRSGGDYCGWAPLPPFAVFRPGVGFFYRGVGVGVNFDFGLGADCFVFVSPDHFCDRHPRSFCVDRARVTQIFHQTTIINHYDVNNHGLVNRGFGVKPIASATHHPVETVHVSALPNAGRQGWRGEGFERTLRPATANYHPGTTSLPGRKNNLGGTPVGNNDLRRPGINNQQVGNEVVPRREAPGQTSPGTQPGGRVQSPGVVPGQPLPQARQNNNFAEPNRAVPPNQWLPSRSGSPVVNQATPPRQFVPAEPPRSDVRPNAAEPPARNFSPPPAAPAPAPAPSPAHNTGGGGNKPQQ
jgi:hypothetical protein